MVAENRLFPSCCETHYESEARCKALQSFVCILIKSNIHMKSFAPSLAFITRFTATRKWPIESKLKCMVFRSIRAWHKKIFNVF